MSPFCFFFASTPHFSLFFFFNDTATTEIYTLSLHDALPICWTIWSRSRWRRRDARRPSVAPEARRQSTPRSRGRPPRSEEHTSELQSQSNLVCRLLLEKKKKTKKTLLLDTDKSLLCLARTMC